MAKKKAALILTLQLLIFSSTVAAQNRYWRMMKTQKVVTFDWNCAQQLAFPKRALGKIVSRAIPTDRRGIPGTYGDRAFGMNLLKECATVYFVPTTCGGTGNCTWRLYTINPLKYLGEIGGEYIYTYQSEEEMPAIITYTHMSAAEGILSTYVQKNGRYRWLGDEYKIDYQALNGHQMPKFLEKAKRLCKGYGE